MKQLEVRQCDRHDINTLLPYIFGKAIETDDTPQKLADCAESVLRFYGCDEDTELTVYLSSSKMYFDGTLTAANRIGCKLNVGIWERTAGGGFYHIYDMTPIPAETPKHEGYDVRLCAWPETRASVLSPDDPDNPVNWEAVIPGALEHPFKLEETEHIALENTAKYAGKQVLLYVNGADFVFVPVLNALLKNGCTVTLQHYNPATGTSCLHTLTK